MAKRWFYASMIPLGPFLGWLSHEIYQPSGHSAMGLAFSISWSGFWLARVLSTIDWRNL